MPTEPDPKPRRMSCWNCPRYSRTDRRCREGKANPRRKSDSFAVAENLGLRALCYYNPYRDPLAMRMFFPTDPATIRFVAQSAKQSRRAARQRKLQQAAAESSEPEVTAQSPDTEAAPGAGS